MENSFETQFSAYQVAMVSICLEYCEYKASAIFIHTIFERDSIFANFFFRMNGRMYKKGMLGDIIGKVSLPRQKEALSIVTQNTKKIIKLCEENYKPIPSEMKLIYDVNTNSLKANYSYDPVTSNEITAMDVTEAWFMANKAE